MHNKDQKAPSLCLGSCFSLFSFTSLPSSFPFGSKPHLTSSIPQQTHIDTQQTHTHTVSELQKTSRCGSGSAFSEALVFLSQQTQEQRRGEIFALLSYTGKLLKRGRTVKVFLGKKKHLSHVSPKTDLKLAREQVVGGERRKTGKIKMRP